jgi:integrase|tara:strand:+ start:262 stop:1617 length:1356 start_codon:yes stop_codon:yes gene_type:complete
MGKISKAKKLTDAICRDLPRLDKNYFKPGDYPGLQFWVKTGGSKSWFYQYRTKHKKFPQRKKIGNYPVIGVVEAIKRAKDLSTKIYNGEDPKEAETIDVLKMQFGEAIRNYYREELTTVNQYSASTIAGIKGVFGPWVFRNTYDKDILDRVSKTEDIQYKKLSSITPKMFKNLYNVVGSRSPINANRLQEYLRKFWNDFVKAPNNPFVLKKKYKNTENVYLDYLDKLELPRVMNVLVQIDYRTQRLNYKHYKDKGLKPVSCLVLALLLTTGRRLKEVATLTWPQFKQGESPRLELKKTKTSRKNNKLVFKLGNDAVNILNLIARDRLNNPESAFYFSVDDPRNNYIFPSKAYGRNNKKGKTTCLYVQDPGATWDSALKLGGVERHMKIHSTRHTFATNFYRVTKDIKGLAEALGTTEAQASRYAKLDLPVEEGINKIDFFGEKKVILKNII